MKAHQFFVLLALALMFSAALGGRELTGSSSKSKSPSPPPPPYGTNIVSAMDANTTKGLFIAFWDTVTPANNKMTACQSWKGSPGSCTKKIPACYRLGQNATNSPSQTATLCPSAINKACNTKFAADGSTLSYIKGISTFINMGYIKFGSGC